MPETKRADCRRQSLELYVYVVHLLYLLQGEIRRRRFGAATVVAFLFLSMETDLNLPPAEMQPANAEPYFPSLSSRVLVEEDDEEEEEEEEKKNPRSLSSSIHDGYSIFPIIIHRIRITVARVPASERKGGKQVEGTVAEPEETEGGR